MKLLDRVFEFHSDGESVVAWGRGDGEEAPVAPIVRVVVREGPLEVLAGPEPDRMLLPEHELLGLPGDRAAFLQPQHLVGLCAHQPGEHVPHHQRHFRSEVETPDVHLGHDEEAHQATVDHSQPAGRRHGERLGEHDEGQEQERCPEERLPHLGRQVHSLGYREHEKRHEIREEEGSFHIETPDLPDDEHAADEHEGQQCGGAHPPRGRTAQGVRRYHDGYGGRVEDVSPAKGQHVLGSGGRYRRHGQGHEIRSGRIGIDDQGEDESGDVCRFHVRRGAEDPGERPVGEYRQGDQESSRREDVQGVEREQSDAPEQRRHEHQDYQNVEHQPVHGGRVEDPVDEAEQGVHRSSTAT